MRIRDISLKLAVLGCLCGVVLAAKSFITERPFQSDNIQNETVATNYTFNSPGKKNGDDFHVSIEGLCEVSPKSVNCWEPNGTPSPSLTSATQVAISFAPLFRLQLKFRRRSLLLVASPSTSFQSDKTSTYFGMTWKTSSCNLDIEERLSFGDNHSYFWIYTLSNDAFDDLSLKVLSQVASKVLLPCKVGASISVDGGMVKLTAISKTQIRKYYPSAIKFWIINFDRNVKNSEKSFPIRICPVDSNGKVINSFDQDGKPSQFSMGAISSAGEGQFENDKTYISYVDPKYIKSYQVYANATYYAKFLNVAMKPSADMQTHYLPAKTDCNWGYSVRNVLKINGFTVPN